MTIHSLDTIGQGQTLQQNKTSRRTFLSGVATFMLVGSTAAVASACTGQHPSIFIDFVYSTEKHAWLSQATTTFNALQKTWQDKIIQVNPVNTSTDGWEYGSLDAAKRILNGEIQPVAWSPANEIEITYLDQKWKKMHGSQAEIINFAGNYSPRFLVFSPLVFAIWKERSKVLQQYYSQQGGITWDNLQDAFGQTNGWIAIGGSAVSNWGPVKFGHTRPDKSNSGLLTLILLAYHMMRRQRGLTKPMIDSATFLNPLNVFENAVNAFGRSSGTFLTDVVIPEGPSSYDVITTYENLVLTNDRLFDIFYPPQNMSNEHPFAILKASWVSSDQREAARIFREFLLNPDMQILARSFGFRPANPAVSLTKPVITATPNPFTSTTLSIQPLQGFQSSEAPPDADVIDELIARWIALYDKRPIATG